MARTDDSPAATEERTIVVSRVLNAPRERVWVAWTRPEHVAKWWGPRGFSTRVEELDFRVGGRSRYVMIGPDGTEYPVSGTFLEIVPLERIVTTDEFDEGFEKQAGMDLPKGIVLTSLFEDLGGKTRLTLQIVHTSAEERVKHENMGVVGGWNSTIDCLEEYLVSMNPTGTEKRRGPFTVATPTDRSILLTRVFYAPRALVHEVMTNPDHLRRWLTGPPGWSMTVCENDPTAGGSFCHVWRGPDGTEMSVKGVHREVDAPARTIRTEAFSLGDMPLGEHLATLELAEAEGVTTMTIDLQYDSPQARDGMLSSGMDQGAGASYDRLEDIVAELAAGA